MKCHSYDYYNSTFQVLAFAYIYHTMDRINVIYIKVTLLSNFSRS